MKKSANEVNGVSESNLPSNEGIDPVPANLPVLPKGRVAPAKVGKKGRRPRNGLTEAASGLSKELRKNATALKAELGPNAVDPMQLASALDLALAWHSAADQAATFDVYARGQRGASWDAAVGLMGGLQLGVRFALKRDPKFAERFPATAKAFAPTKRSKAKKAATSAKPKAAKPAPAPAPQPEVAPAASETVAAEAAPTAAGATA